MPLNGRRKRARNCEGSCEPFRDVANGLANRSLPSDSLEVEVETPVWFSSGVSGSDSHSSHVSEGDE